MDKSKSFRNSLWWTAATVAVDRVVKIAAFRLPEEGILLIPGVLRLRYAENRGMAFSLLSGYPRLLGGMSLCAIAGMIWLMRKKKMSAWPRFALSLMLGGAIGNAIDRLALGFVPDLIETLFVRFAIFNVADAALTVGCAMMLCSLLFRPGDWADKGRTGKEDGKPDGRRQETER